MRKWERLKNIHPHDTSDAAALRERTLSSCATETSKCWKGGMAFFVGSIFVTCAQEHRGQSGRKPGHTAAACSYSTGEILPSYPLPMCTASQSKGTPDQLSHIPD